MERCFNLPDVINILKFFKTGEKDEKINPIFIESLKKYGLIITNDSGTYMLQLPAAEDLLFELMELKDEYSKDPAKINLTEILKKHSLNTPLMIQQTNNFNNSGDAFNNSGDALKDRSRKKRDSSVKINFKFPKLLSKIFG